MLYRDLRIADAIKDTVADIITTKISDPGIGFVTITRCTVSPDYRHATIYLSILGDDRRRADGLEHIRHAAGYIRHQLGKRLRLRYLPQLNFALDELLEQQNRIGHILNELQHHPPHPDTGYPQP